MNKFTPGPWEVDGFNTTSVIVKNAHPLGPSDPKWHRICICNYGYTEQHRHFYENQANAQLIAAAPELLEALQLLVDCCDGNYTEAVALAMVAISKATAK